MLVLLRSSSFSYTPLIYFYALSIYFNILYRRDCISTRFHHHDLSIRRILQSIHYNATLPYGHRSRGRAICLFNCCVYRKTFCTKTKRQNKVTDSNKPYLALVVSAVIRNSAIPIYIRQLLFQCRNAHIMHILFAILCTIAGKRCGDWNNLKPKPS